MTPVDRETLAKWLTANLVPAPGSYVSASEVRSALYEDTGLFPSITMLGHQVRSMRAQSHSGTLYLDWSLRSPR